MMHTAMVSAMVMGGLGVLFAVGLAYAAQLFRVDADPRVELLASALPGANCGGCGFSGCQGFAEALVKEEAPLNACRVCGHEALAQVSSILGKETPVGITRQVARVMCGGNRESARWLARYEGAEDCRAAVAVGSSPKGCSRGCLGLGSCVKACPFGAIQLGADSLPVVNEDKCTGCGVCAKACPQGVVAVMDIDLPVLVRCNSHDRGRVVRDVCQVGCIACKACEKACVQGAVRVVDNLAVVDAARCTGCGLCTEKCPTGCLATAGMPKVGEKLLA